MNGMMMKAAVLGRCQTGHSHGVAVFVSCGNTSQFSYVHACTNPCFTQSMSLVTSVINPWLTLDADLINQTSWEAETLPISLNSGCRQTLNYPDLILRGWDSTEFIKLYPDFLSGWDSTEFIKLYPDFLKGWDSTEFIKLYPDFLSGWDSTEFIKLYPDFLKGWDSTEFIKLYPDFLRGWDSTEFIKLYPDFLKGWDSTEFIKLYPDFLSGWKSVYWSHILVYLHTSSSFTGLLRSSLNSGYTYNPQWSILSLPPGSKNNAVVKVGSVPQFSRTSVKLTLMLLVANLANRKWCKKPYKWLKPWQMGTHLRVLSESYLMNTNMTGFGWFSKRLASLCFGRK